MRKRRRHTTEAVAVVFIILALLLLLSFLTYHPLDPSWATSASEGQEVRNAIGRVGASLSDLFFQLFGFAAFMMPFALLLIGLQSFIREDETSLVSEYVGLFLSVFVVAGILSLFFGTMGWRGAEIPAGGFFGSLISTFFIRYFNHIGSVFILFGILFLVFLFATQISLSAILRFLVKLARGLITKLRVRLIQFKKNQQRRKMQERVIKKYAEPKEASPNADKKPEKVKEKKAKKKTRLVVVKDKKVLKEAQPVAPPPQFNPPQETPLFPEMDREGDYMFPSIKLLDPAKAAEKIDKNELQEKKLTIEEKLREFQIDGEVKEYHPGPVITTYEFYPSPGVRVSQVANLGEDLSLALRAESVRIQRIPGKPSIGIEAPNNNREIIKLRDVLESDKFQNSRSKLTFALGKTVHGEVYVTDLSVMPHLLIAGATGTGKSVALNVLIASILYKATPDEVKLILIDPKRLEFSLYDGIPHLLTPVVRDPRKAERILMAAVKEMEARYHKLGFLGVRNIEQYNQQVTKILSDRKTKLTEEEQEKLEPLPYIVIIIDELAELMMIGPQEVEYCIARLAQLARAVGLHLVLATQRPSIDVITGTIKNNFPSRIAFRVPSKVDSRIIIDTSGADQLLGMGDMLFMPPNYPRLMRLHCSFISLPEVNRLIKFVKGQAKPVYDETLAQALKAPVDSGGEEGTEKDALFEKAVEIVLVTGQASASFLQRKLKLGYARASRIVDQMEQEGILGPSEGSKPREILVSPETYLANLDRDD